MSTCPSERALWALSEGDGTAAECEHVARCPRCVERARRLASDLAVLADALRRPVPVAGPAAPYHRVVGVTWGVAGALVAISLLVMVLAKAPLLGSRSGESGDGVAAMTALSTEVFAEDAPSDTTRTGLDVLARAFEVAGPCEWDTGGCEDDSIEPPY